MVTQFAGFVDGFHNGDTIDLAGIGFNNAGGAMLQGGNVLQVTENSQTYNVKLDPNQNFAGVAFQVKSDTTGGIVITPTVNPYDLAGNGYGDVVVQGTDGNILYANMLGGAFQNWAEVANASGWNVVGEGKIAGNASADVVIQNPGSGQIAYADMVNGSFSSWVGVANAPGYNVVGVGDINGDHYANIVVQSPSSGQVLYANMNGGVFHNWGAVGTVPGFNVAGIGDINSDGYANIVVQNPGTGEIDYANMANGVFNGWASVAGAPGFNVAGVGDINRDGFANIVMQNPAPARSSMPAWPTALSPVG